MRQCISIKTICPELDPSQTKLPNHHASVSVIWTRSFAPQRRLQSARLISSDFQRFQNISNISISFSCNETGTWNFCTVWDQEPDDFVHGNLGVDLRVSWAAFLLAQWCLKWFRRAPDGACAQVQWQHNWNPLQQQHNILHNYYTIHHYTTLHDSNN